MGICEKSGDCSRRKKRRHLQNNVQFQAKYGTVETLIEASPQQSSPLTHAGQYYSSKFNWRLHTQPQGEAVNNPAGAGLYCMSRTQINKPVIASTSEVPQPRSWIFM